MTAEDSGFLSKIPIFGPLLGFFASLFTLYSWGAFRKRHNANLQRQYKEQAALPANVEFVGADKVPGLSGLNGKALIAGKKYPTKPEVMAAIPKHLMQKDTFKSMMYALMSTALTGLCVYAGTFIPYSWAYAWAWALYGIVTGTVATGCWVIAHECGHSAFSDNKLLQDTVGYTLHSLLLVPYFSWQRSHAVHHANTNHMETGETHVPGLAGNAGATSGVAKLMGPLWPILHTVVVLLFGWPMYLMFGESGGPAYGKTNHFWPYAPFNNGEKELFPGKHKARVLLSDIGVLAVIAGLVAWGATWGAMYPILHYVLPYLGVNCWLVGYTWLQHTDVDVPHFDSNEYTWAKGAFHTIDRPYGPVLDFLHHGIGSTHVTHHVNSAIPHYNAWKVTEHLKSTFPDIYLYDPTPVHKALWRVAKNCIAVGKQPGQDGMYVWLKDPSRSSVAVEQDVKPTVQQTGQPVLATV
jgi:omega-6 fatty acid desaturase (delta-12 desaturase)